MRRAIARARVRKKTPWHHVVVIVAATAPTAAAATTTTDVLAEARVGKSFEKQQTSKNSRLGRQPTEKK